MTTNNPTLQTTPTDDQFTNNGGRVDAVYIVATPGEIAFIKPMIAMRNGSQSGATLYASSRSAQGTAGPDFRLEMEGLQYSEIPMLAGGNLPLMQQALSAVNNDYSLARMYAMGVDAWSLANHFSQMRQIQGFEINGNTGSLTASPDCVINRKLSWLQYQQAGSPRQLTTKQTGDAWEAQARRWLEGKGLRFIAANVNERGGEIDLIMREGRTTVFIEVRYRRSALYGGAAASVTRSKQHKLLQTARLWLARHNGSFDTVDCRFDVVAFTGNEVEWIKNAFNDHS